MSFHKGVYLCGHHHNLATESSHQSQILPMSPPTTPPVNWQSGFCHRGYFAFLRIAWKWNRIMCVLSCEASFTHMMVLRSTHLGLYPWLIPFYCWVLSTTWTITLCWFTLSFWSTFFHLAYRRKPSQPPFLDPLVFLTPILGPRGLIRSSSCICYTDSHCVLTLYQGFQHFLEPNDCSPWNPTPAFLTSPIEHICIRFLLLL